MRKSAVVAMVKEPHSNFCGGCRQWIKSEEVVSLFSAVDGVEQRVVVWLCLACRGDAPEDEAKVEVARGPVTAADLSKDEHRGPFRDVVPGTYAANPSGLTGRVRLTCGHGVTVFVKAVRWRCTKPPCRPKKEKAS